MRVLVVDDSPIMRKIVRMNLAKLGGVEIIEATNGEEAIKILRTGKTSLILADLNMPVLDGIGLLELVGSEETLADVPIVIISDKLGPEMIKRCRTLGATGFLPKPFNLNEFNKIIVPIYEKVMSGESVVGIRLDGALTKMRAFSEGGEIGASADDERFYIEIGGKRASATLAELAAIIKYHDKSDE